MPPEEGFGRVADALRWGQEELDHAGIPGSRLEATLLLGHVLGLDRAQILARLAEAVGPEAAGRYRELIRRRSRREPLQYLRGKARFLDFEVRVEPGVLVPRPETELVVEAALRAWDAAGSSRWAVDVGTGSGAIALALARARPRARICAIERSATALRVARRNVQEQGLAERVLLVQGDLLAPLGADDDPGPTRRTQAVELVVSNPPYAAIDDPVDPEVRRHEPPEAWAAGPSGAEVYVRLIPQAARLLPPGRALVLELGYGRETEVRKLLAEGPWEEPLIEADHQGIPRALTAFRTGAA